MPEICNSVISGTRVKFFRRDFLMKGGWLKEEPEKTDSDRLDEIIDEEKPNQREKVKFRLEDLVPYFPESSVEEIRDITKYIIEEKTVDMLVYGLTPGYKPLREAYLKWIVEPKGVKASLENVICFTGSGQGIDLTCDPVAKK